MAVEDKPVRSHKHATLILFNVCVGQFIVGLDQRALLVALPTLTHTFTTSLTTIQWVLLIYDLALIGLVITVGRLGDLFGRRQIYAGGFLFFVLASALCGISQSAGQLILFGAAHSFSRPASGGWSDDCRQRESRRLRGISLEPERQSYGLCVHGFSYRFFNRPNTWGILD